MSSLALLLKDPLPLDDKKEKPSCITFGIGILAAVITSAILIPQVYVTYRDRVPYYGLTTMVYTFSITAKVLWTIYGSLRKDTIIIGGAVFETIIVGLLLLSQVIFKNDLS
jgi:uncharacterized protein with PQ loop repeat